MTESLEKILGEPLSSGSHGPVPDMLQELFNRDPLSLSTQDIEKIVAVMREQRKAFLAEESSAKAQGRAPKYKSVVKKATEGFDPSKLDL